MAMDFLESTTYLLSLGNEVSAMKLGLEDIRRLLVEFDKPQKDYLKVQVAGTNGKGSVCAFLDSICVHAGIKTGLYTSPHLISITERIKVEDEEISEADFARHATTVRSVSEKLVADSELGSIPTFFEQVTAIALIHFAEQKVELAILETGLGGRLDATTAANAEIVAITQIDIDHQEYLGESLAEIAAEKAAIIRPGVKAVVARQSEEAECVIDGRCREVGVAPVWATTDIVTTTWDYAGLYLAYTHSFKTERRTYPRIDPLLLGRHQAGNAAVAIAVAEILEREYFDISEMEICLGLETAVHPGRLELIYGVLLDGAHNRAGARALREFLDESIDRPIVMIFGAMQDKDIPSIADILFEKAYTLVLTTAANPRAFTTDEIAELLPERISSGKVILTRTAAEALASARKIAGDEKLIVVTGSLYLVGEVRSIINKTLDKA